MKNRKFWISLMAGIMAGVMFLGLVLSALPVSARSSGEIRDQINQLQAEQDRIQEQMDALRGEQDQNQSDTEDVVLQKNQIDQQIGLLYAKIENINRQIDAFNVLIADKQEELDLAQERLTELNIKNRERIRAMEEAGKLSYWSVLFKAHSFSDLLDRLNMIEEIAAADRRRIAELSDAAARVRKLQENLLEEKEGLEQSRQELDASREEMKLRREESGAALNALVAKAEELDNDMFNYDAIREELLAEIAREEANFDNAKYQEWLATSETTTAPTEPPTEPDDPDEPTSAPEDGSGNGQDYIPSTGEGWIIPCDYVYVSSPFGWREPPTEGASTFHSGIDLAGYAGTPIYASRSGVVSRAGYNEFNGYFVGINHGDEFSSVYLHMTHYVVDIGDYVSQGQLIGYMGSTGIATGDHLHLTIYYNGSPVNPADYIDFY